MTHPLPAERMTASIGARFDDVAIVEAGGDLFFFAGAERRFPFTTIVTHDSDFDSLSRLDRPDVYRLNIGLNKATFRRLFPDQGEVPDYSVFDRLMPHPVYGTMYWVCVLNPDERLAEVMALLDAAHAVQAGRSARRPASEGTGGA